MRELGEGKTPGHCQDSHCCFMSAAISLCLFNGYPSLSLPPSFRGCVSVCEYICTERNLLYIRDPLRDKECMENLHKYLSN